MYVYDEIYRLKDAAGTLGTEKFGYDDVGNRTQGPSPLDTSATYQHNAANQMITGRLVGFTYDNMGNQTARTVPGGAGKSWTQTWDFENRLTKVEKVKGAERKTVTFMYDPFGRRIEKKVETVIKGK